MKVKYNKIINLLQYNNEIYTEDIDWSFVFYDFSAI